MKSVKSLVGNYVSSHFFHGFLVENGTGLTGKDKFQSTPANFFTMLDSWSVVFMSWQKRPQFLRLSIESWLVNKDPYIGL